MSCIVGLIITYIIDYVLLIILIMQSFLNCQIILKYNNNFFTALAYFLDYISEDI